MTGFLLVIAVVLGLVAASQLMKIYQLSSAVKGHNDYDLTPRENKFQAILMPIFLIYFFGFIIYQLVEWGGYVLPVSASEHGETIDQLMNTTWWIIVPVFVITHIVLFYFCYKYAYDANRKASYFAHSNKLELIWTLVPTVVLAALILYGLSVWNDIFEPVAEEDNPITLEIYGKQFDWTARYTGKDGQLGRANYKLIDLASGNSLGLDTTDVKAKDDILVKGEFHLPVNRPVQFQFRAQEVIHSAYMPHFRAQMNCVPGMVTQFNFVPNKTTAEMREITGNPEFEYVLLCNKICGAAHYNMKMTIVVESEEDYQKWLSEQDTFMGTASLEESNENEALKAEVVEEEKEVEEEETSGV